MAPPWEQYPNSVVSCHMAVWDSRACWGPMRITEVVPAPLARVAAAHGAAASAPAPSGPAAARSLGPAVPVGPEYPLPPLPAAELEALGRSGCATRTACAWARAAGLHSRAWMGVRSSPPARGLRSATHGVVSQAVALERRAFEWQTMQTRRCAAGSSR